MIFAVILLPPGLMGLLLVLGRYEELLFTPPAARHARRTGFLGRVPRHGCPAGPEGQCAPRPGSDGATGYPRGMTGTETILGTLRWMPRARLREAVAQQVRGAAGEPGAGQADRGPGGDVTGVEGAAVDAFDGHHRRGNRACGAGQGPGAGVIAAVNATAAAVCPEGKEEEQGRSSTSLFGIHSVGGRGRSASCLHTALEANWARLSAVMPAAAARRPRPPPKHAINTAAPHHSLVRSAVSSTADSCLPTRRGSQDAIFLVSCRSAARSPAINLMSCRYPRSSWITRKSRSVVPAQVRFRPCGGVPARSTCGCRAAPRTAQPAADGRRRWPAVAWSPRRTPGRAGWPGW